MKRSLEQTLVSINPLLQRSSTVYDAAGEGIATIDPLGRRSSTLYDLAGRALATLDPLARRTSNVYDAAGQGVARIDPLGRRGSTLYDADGRVVASVNALNERSTTVYDAAGESIATIDPLGRRASTLYDLAGRALATIDALGQRTTTVYDVAGESIASIDPLLRRNSTVYDLASRTLASINPLGERTSTVYDAAGESVGSIDALGRRGTTVFDLDGRTASSINALGQRSTTVYDAAGESIASIDPLGRRNSTLYDLAGRSVASINALGERASTVYDAAGESIASIDALGRRSSTVYDLAGESIASIDPLGQRSSTVYDAAGESIASIDPLGRRNSTVYDLAGRTLASINPLGQRTSTVYDAAGETVGSIDPLGRRGSTLYDLTGRTVASINPLGERTSTVYDAAGESVASIDPLGRRSSTVYDLAGRSLATINALGERGTTVYDAAGETIASIDPLLRRSSSLYDLAGRTVASINPLGQRSSTVYDAAGESIASIDPLGRRSSTLYDLAGRTVASINALGLRTSSVYDAAGESIASIDPLLRRNSTLYDLAGRSVASINALGERTSTVYDASGESIASIDALGLRTSTLYDLAGRSLSSINPLGQRSSTVYDAAGESIASIDALGLRSSTIYDLAGRTFASINPLGQRTTTLYDAAGESIAAIDPLTRRHSTVYDLAGRALASVTPLNERSSTVYDAAGESIASISALGCRISSSYDLAGRRIRLTDPKSHATTFLYDNAGQQVGQIDPLLRRVSYAYDLAGQRTLVLDARGLRISSVYDAAGQRTAELLPNSQRTSYGYDLAGRRALLNDSFGRTSTTYDAKGRTVVVAQPGGKSVTYAYDAADRRVYITDPDGGRTSYSHDAAGRLLAVNAPGAGRTTMAYDAANRLIARWPAGSARVSQVYDAAGQQTLMAATSSTGTPVNRFSYTYDWAGRRVQVFYIDGSRATYMYDSAGQLIREQRNGTLAANATFTYDAAGNRILLLDSGQPTTSSYDAANQHLLDVTPTGRTTYLYDLAGNRTQLETAAASTYYDWDVYNRLTQAEPVSGPVSMAYDGDGRRVQRQTPTETRRFVYDFEKVLQDIDDNGLTQKQYASTEEQYGDLLSAYGDGQARYFAADALGSTDALLAPDGSTPDRWAYRAFGLESHTQGTDDNRYTWVGRQGYYEEREIGLYLLNKRDFDPRTGLFVSPDPSGFAAGDANLYRYAFNDPINQTDPSGLQASAPACKPDTPVKCDLERELQEYIKGFGRLKAEFGEVGDSFKDAWNKNAPKKQSQSSLQSILDGFNPREIASNASACFCFLKGKVLDREAWGLGLDCFKEVGLAGFGVAWSLFRGEVPAPPEIPQSCWGVAYKFALQGQPPATDSASAKVKWLLKNLDHPCLRAIPLAKPLVEAALSYSDSFVAVIELVEELWDKKDEYKKQIIDFVSKRIEALEGCLQMLWNWVNDQVKKILTEALTRLKVPDIAQKIIVSAVCLTLESLKDSVIEAVKKPVEWLEAVKKGIEAVINPLENIKTAFQGIGANASKALENFAKGDFGEAGVAAKAVLDGTISIVEDLGGYIYLVLIAAPAAVGSVVPGAGTAALAALGQKINSVIAVVLNLIKTASKFVGTALDVEKLWELIEKKVSEARTFAESVQKALTADKDLDVESLSVEAILKQMQDNAPDEIPLLVFNDDEINNVLTGALTSILTTAVHSGVGLILSLIGTGVAKISDKFIDKFKDTINGKAKANANKRCATCAKNQKSPMAKAPKKKCFPAGTLVHAERGVLPIETLARGEWVWGRDARTGAWQLARVVETFARHYEGEFITIRLASGGEESIISTAGHPFWVEAGSDLASRPSLEEWLDDEPDGDGRAESSSCRGRWVQARDVRVGDVLTSKSGGRCVVASVASRMGSAAVYNLHVEGVQTYLVGRAGVLVQNVSLPSDCKDLQCDPMDIMMLATNCKKIAGSRKLAKECPKKQARLVQDCAAAVKAARANGKVTSTQKASCPDKPTCCLKKRQQASQSCKPPSGRVSYGGLRAVTFEDQSGNNVTGMVGENAMANLTPANVGGTRSDFNVVTWFQKLRKVAGHPIEMGHILASSLGGSGNKNWNNLTPLYDDANSPAISTCENFLAKLVTECHYCVTVKITARGYGRNQHAPLKARPAFPSSILIEWSLDDGCASGKFEVTNKPDVAVPTKCQVGKLPCRQ